MSNLSTFYPAPITAADLGLGAGSNATFGSIQNTPIGNTTPAAGTFTTLTADTRIVGPQGTAVGSSSTPAFSIGASNTGIYVSGNQLIFTQGGIDRAYFDNTGRLFLTGTGGLSIGATGTGINFTRSVSLNPDATGTLAQRSTTQAQTFQLYNTTDGPLANFERGFLRWSSNVLQIGTEKGGTGSARALEFQTDGTTRWTITTAGLLTVSPADSGGFILSNGWMNYRAGTTNHWAVVSGNITARSAGYFQWSGQADASNFSGDTLRLSRPSGGALLLEAGTTTTHRFLFGGTTSSFPALKRDSTVLQARLADDSDFAPLQGRLRIHQNAVSETITATHTLTLFDAAGTAYKVPCVAA